MSNRKRPRGRPSKYPPEFQPDAVAMVLDEGRAIAEVGRAIGVNEGTLGNFRPRVHAGESSDGSRVGPSGLSDGSPQRMVVSTGNRMHPIGTGRRHGSRNVSLGIFVAESHVCK